MAEGSDHTASWGQEAGEATERGGTRVAQVLGGERDLGTQRSAEPGWAGLDLDPLTPSSESFSI